MLQSTNINQLKMNFEPIKLNLELDKIPVYKGVNELLDNGFESTLAPANKIFLKNIDSINKSRFELICNDFVPSSSLYKNMLKVLLDPQTCGPLVISCSSIYSQKLISMGPWKRIGFIT